METVVVVVLSLSQLTRLGRDRFWKGGTYVQKEVRHGAGSLKQGS